MQGVQQSPPCSALPKSPAPTPPPPLPITQFSLLKRFVGYGYRFLCHWGGFRNQAFYTTDEGYQQLVDAGWMVADVWIFLPVDALAGV